MQTLSSIKIDRLLSFFIFAQSSLYLFTCCSRILLHTCACMQTLLCLLYIHPPRPVSRLRLKKYLNLASISVLRLGNQRLGNMKENLPEMLFLIFLLPNKIFLGFCCLFLNRMSWIGMYVKENYCNSFDSETLYPQNSVM